MEFSNEFAVPASKSYVGMRLLQSATTRTSAQGDFGKLDCVRFMTGPLPPHQEFHTWPEIAEYLHISVREALYRAKNEGLPVRRGPGKKSRVWAFRSELDAWKLKGPASVVRPAPNPAIEQPPADSPSSPSPVDERRAPAVRWGRRTVRHYPLRHRSPSLTPPLAHHVRLPIAQQ